MNNFEKTLKEKKINIKKLDSSIKSFDYHTQNFFNKTTIVPSVHIGETDRIPKNNLNERSLPEYYRPIISPSDIYKLKNK
jgi:hypothetical protein